MTMRLDHLEKLFVSQLKDMHSAERQLVEALPKMRDAAVSEPLRATISSHLKETQTHIERLDRIFGTLEFKPGGHKCAAMAGLIEEGKEILKADADPKVRDAAIICAAQKIEHYEIATYGCLRAWARLLGRDDAARLINETLREEREADDALSGLADQWVNAFAMQGA
jgi:ferritin-like metal-binding protein YciE